jgi:hypothetical protein
MQSQQKNMSKLFIGDSGRHGPDADVYDSYEGLPPDYTLGHNMLAGAFAGIAVRFFSLAPQRRKHILGLTSASGTFGDVPSRSLEGVYRDYGLHWDQGREY